MCINEKITKKSLTWIDMSFGIIEINVEKIGTSIWKSTPFHPFQKLSTSGPLEIFLPHCDVIAVLLNWETPPKSRAQNGRKTDFLPRDSTFQPKSKWRTLCFLLQPLFHLHPPPGRSPTSNNFPLFQRRHASQKKLHFAKKKNESDGGGSYLLLEYLKLARPIFIVLDMASKVTLSYCCNVFLFFWYD